ncbi:unnamed protein product [Clonostachys rhizophaga]|uniref:PLL-like beta propeller domain-containing protein n=1 Tax=Clonostachys rhizophaga TaxID=160324 RepID=A0A9N9VTZ1_9HYPO|nr:unnamed protein product [Clonostachys rhizophaga]
MAYNRFEGSDLPQVYDRDNLPQVYDRESLPQVYQGHRFEEGLQILESESPESQAAIIDPGSTGKAPEPFWTRKKIGIAAGVAALIVIGVVVGTAVGVVTSRKGTGSGESSSQPTGTEMALTATTTSFPTPSVVATTCHPSICPAILAAARPSSDPKAFFLFGRGTDNAIWYRESDGERWLKDWESLGGKFDSQPAAVSIREGQIDVFGIDTDKTMRTKSYRNSAWESSWASLGGACNAAPAVCSMREGRMDLFTLSSTNDLAHKYYENGQWASLSSGSGWGRSEGYVASSLAASCRGNNFMDVTVYGNEKAPFKIASTHWNGSDFERWSSLTGHYKSNPSTIAMTENRTDFLGLNSDKAMVYLSWGDGADLSKLKTTVIGGEAQSVAGLVSPRSGRLDAFAVGNDSKLKHKALVGSEWGSSWDDLGGAFNSAPLALPIGNDSILVFGIGPGGKVIHTKLQIGSENSLSASNWFSDGGSLSVQWLSAGPA